VGSQPLPPMSRQWDSNPQPSVYKTDALPLSYAGNNCINIIKDIRKNSKILILTHRLTFLEFYVLKTIFPLKEIKILNYLDFVWFLKT
jgi:hypothetical protein